MATTTNYGWTTPDDTALVKDGAAAIRTLGSSVDTTTKNLNPETTLGDLAYRSSTANVKTRLALGTANQVLAVNSGATAPEWKTVSGGGMTLLSTTTLSGTSTTISSIDQTYKDLFVQVTAVTNSGSNGYRYIRPNNSSGIVQQIVLSTGPNANNETDIYIPRSGTTLGTNANNAAFTYIYNYSSSTIFKSIMGSIAYADDAAGTVSQVFGGAVVTNTAVTSLVFVQTGGGSFNAGTVKIYGVN